MADFRNYPTRDSVLPEQEKRNRAGDRISPYGQQPYSVSLSLLNRRTCSTVAAPFIIGFIIFSTAELLQREASQSEHVTALLPLQSRTASLSCLVPEWLLTVIGNIELGLVPVLEPQSPISLYISDKVGKSVIQT
jgi:hypothetical protein